MRLNLDRTAVWEGRRALREVVGERLVIDDELVVQDDGHAVALDPDPEGVPLTGGPVRFHERVLGLGARRVVPEPAGALLAAEFEVSLAGRIPHLHLRVAAQIDAAVAAGLGKHPLHVQFEVGVVAVSREEHALAVIHDRAVLHLPVGGHVGVPLRLPLGSLLGRALGVFRRVEVRPAPPAGEILAVEERREARGWLGSGRGGGEQEHEKEGSHSCSL